LMTLVTLKHLDLDDNKVKDIAAIEYLVNLEALWLSGNPLNSIDSLSRLPMLTRLGLKNTGLDNKDLDILIRLTKLTELTLEGNKAITANKMDELKKALKNCEISHSELYYTVKLGNTEFTSDAVSISASGAGITALTGLEHFTSLKTLVLSGNNIADLTPLKDLTQLETLDLYGNRVSDLSPLAALTNLRSLSLLDNSISSISALSGMTKLTSLHLSFNNIKDLSPLAGLTNLTVLDLNGNGIRNISALSSLTNLTELDLEYNEISDLTPLHGLTKLRTLYIRGNASLTAEQVRELQKALPDCKIVTNLDLTEPSPENSPEASPENSPEVTPETTPEVTPTPEASLPPEENIEG
ncbi:MAG: leucine-rich repeat domain-containing protein, partial [Oscillospiraceae bacterium]|nr:leucine-rich repeat domain-containing protein [Oscillospiraceae bacterium]